MIFRVILHRQNEMKIVLQFLWNFNKAIFQTHNLFPFLNHGQFSKWLKSLRPIWLTNNLNFVSNALTELCVSKMNSLGPCNFKFKTFKCVITSVLNIKSHNQSLPVSSKTVFHFLIINISMSWHRSKNRSFYAT